AILLFALAKRIFGSPRLRVTANLDADIRKDFEHLLVRRKSSDAEELHDAGSFVRVLDRKCAGGVQAGFSGRSSPLKIRLRHNIADPQRLAAGINSSGDHAARLEQSLSRGPRKVAVGSAVTAPNYFTAHSGRLLVEQPQRAEVPVQGNAKSLQNL